MPEDKKGVTVYGRPFTFLEGRYAFDLLYAGSAQTNLWSLNWAVQQNFPGHEEVR
jgi:hypothetical protein